MSAKCWMQGAASSPAIMDTGVWILKPHSLPSYSYWTRWRRFVPLYASGVRS